ncbi:MAG: TetR/AcrR family transcriptional regulator [Pseudomonadales bacterium]
MSRQNRTSELKNRVMQVALTHFSKAGIERTNVGDILKDAQCSVGSLYHHFGNKEGIAEALFIEGIRQFNGGLLAALLSRRTGETGVRAIIRYCCQWVTEQPALAAFLLSREIKLSESAKRELKELDRAFGQALYDWFVPHVQKGELLELPRSLYIPIICGPTLEYSRLWLSGRNRRSPDDVSALLAEAAWQSIRGDLTP